MKKSELKQIIKEEIKTILTEEVKIYTGRFLSDAEKFLRAEIKKGIITGMDIDDADIAAEHIYNALISHKNK